ncbi:MAG: TetR/AcrR family transcriptional regulator [Solirubrobacteraceae bacterium]
MFEHRRSGADAGWTEDPRTDDSPASVGAKAAAAALANRPRGDPRERLLDAMIQAVAERGYDRTTVSRLLSRAEVPEAVFSEHFRDKHDCFMQAIDGLIGRGENSAIALFAQARPWPERVSRALEGLLSNLAEHPDAADVLFVEMLGAGPAACERHREALSLFAALLEEGRTLCVNSGHLPKQTSEAIVGGIASIVHRRALQGKLAELPALHADLTYFALLPYLEHDRAAAIAGLG